MDTVRNEIIKALAGKYKFHYTINESGNYEIDYYETSGGCYVNNQWLSIYDVIECLVNDCDWYTVAYELTDDE